MVARVLQLVIVVLVLSLVASPRTLAQEPTAGTPAAQAGWSFVDVAVEPDRPAVGDVATIRFRVVDAGGVPVSNLRVTAFLRAPVPSFDTDPPDPILTAVGSANGDPGQYLVSVALNQQGRWWLDVQVTGGTGQTARMSQFLVVDPTLGTPPATTDSPLFLPGNAWDAYYRLDPATGSLATLRGQSVLHAGDRWWITQTHLTPVGPVSARYGGTWHVTIDVSDGLTGELVRSLDLGKIRASVYLGSADQPAITTALALSPDGSRIYLYWARQLGQGWMARIAQIDAASGETLHQRDLIGAVTADVFWGQLDVSPDGSSLILAEQAVRATRVGGYRLTVLGTDTLDLIAEHRRSVAPNDPLTECVLAYPGPTGAVAGSPPLRYSLCSPTGLPGRLALVTWDPRTGTPVHQVDLGVLSGASPYSVDGVATPDGSRFYAVNRSSRRVVEIDMVNGVILREASFAPMPSDEPSTWDRLFNWILGAVTPDASASTMLEPGVSIAPDGTELYLVADDDGGSDGGGDGVLVIDTSTLQVTGHLLMGRPVAGVIVTSGGRLVVRQVDSLESEEIAILDPNGQTLVSLALPGQGDMISGTR